MGQDVSQSNYIPKTGFANDIYVPIDSNYKPEYTSETQGRNRSKRATNLYNSPFAGIWSVDIPNCVCPVERKGHFYVQDRERSLLYIGYGLDRNDSPLDDVWVLSLKDLIWTRIEVKGVELSPRVGARAVLFQKYLVIYGGYSQGTYFGDLHLIDLTTCERIMVKTSGDGPTPRCTPILSIFNNQLFVWGGYDGRDSSSTLYVLNLADFTWEALPMPDVTGRTASPYVIFDDKIYSFGSSRVGGLLEIDMTKKKVSIVDTTGAEPPSEATSAGAVKIENMMFYFGGTAKSSYSLVYACNITKKWWFVFYIYPDQETVSVTDGYVSEFGLFQLPRHSNFAIGYDESSRKIIATLGEPMCDPPQVFSIFIGEALGVIHLRDDMSDMFRRSARAP